MGGAVTRRVVKYVRRVTGCRLWDLSHRQQAVILGSRLGLDICIDDEGKVVNGRVTLSPDGILPRQERNIDGMGFRISSAPLLLYIWYHRPWARDTIEEAACSGSEASRGGTGGTDDPYLGEIMAGSITMERVTSEVVSEKLDKHCRVPHYSLFVTRYVYGGAVPKFWFNAPDGAVLQMLYYLTRQICVHYRMAPAPGYLTTLDKPREAPYLICPGRLNWWGKKPPLVLSGRSQQDGSDFWLVPTGRKVCKPPGDPHKDLLVFLSLDANQNARGTMAPATHTPTPVRSEVLTFASATQKQCLFFTNFWCWHLEPDTASSHLYPDRVLVNTLVTLGVPEASSLFQSTSIICLRFRIRVRTRSTAPVINPAEEEIGRTQPRTQGCRPRCRPPFVAKASRLALYLIPAPPVERMEGKERQGIPRLLRYQVSHLGCCGVPLMLAHVPKAGYLTICLLVAWVANQTLGSLQISHCRPHSAGGSCSWMGSGDTLVDNRHLSTDMSVGDGKRKLLLSIPLVAALLLVQIGPMNMRTDTSCMHCHTSIHTGRVQLGDKMLLSPSMDRIGKRNDHGCKTLTRPLPGTLTPYEHTLYTENENSERGRARCRRNMQSLAFLATFSHFGLLDTYPTALRYQTLRK
ncbi:uncharacterized protein CLUP02_10110 [Colletotrichum lupini]|uniref:Uncharacterized protein n=1 Tax=Colletotrichum lupini TaxID=145971 RepID=A0A9Q8SW76_9PEZI|nr:uncharacterized protein CLUP02_10110 [Colletotrichum lupini]UQC84613.1 hypothetical protein CLUP02_10110 [Colletotrichum lupini]